MKIEISFQHDYEQSSEPWNYVHVLLNKGLVVKVCRSREDAISIVKKYTDDLSNETVVNWTLWSCKLDKDYFTVKDGEETPWVIK